METNTFAGFLLKWRGLHPGKELFLLKFQLCASDTEAQEQMKIQVAIARKILVAVWHMLSKGEDFIDIYHRRLEQQRQMEEQLKSLASKMA